MTKKSTKFSAELREHAVRMVFESRGEHGSQWAAIESIAPKIGCSTQTLCNWVWQHERDTGQRDGMTTAEAARIKELERENRELKKANEILKRVSVFFAQVDRPPLQVVKAFVDEHRERFEGESICKLLQVAPSAYWRYAARQRNPELRSSRARRDEELIDEIERVWQVNLQAYGAGKV